MNCRKEESNEAMELWTAASGYRHRHRRIRLAAIHNCQEDALLPLKFACAEYLTDCWKRGVTGGDIWTGCSSLAAGASAPVSVANPKSFISASSRRLSSRDVKSSWNEPLKNTVRRLSS